MAPIVAINGKCIVCVCREEVSRGGYCGEVDSNKGEVAAHKAWMRKARVVIRFEFGAGN